MTFQSKLTAQTAQHVKFIVHSQNSRQDKHLLTSFLFMRQILILTITWYRGCQNKSNSLDQLSVFDKFKESMLTDFQIQISRLKLC